MKQLKNVCSFNSKLGAFLQDKGPIENFLFHARQTNGALFRRYSGVIQALFRR